MVVEISGGTPRQDQADASYRLEEQVGFLLRQAMQRHTGIFADAMIDELTPTQFAALAKLAEQGPTSQNRLGRATAMDVATIKGVIDRLTRRGLTETRPDPEDGRMIVVALTPLGQETVRRAIPVARQITEATLMPLDRDERRRLQELLRKIL